MHATWTLAPNLMHNDIDRGWDLYVLVRMFLPSPITGVPTYRRVGILDFQGTSPGTQAEVKTGEHLPPEEVQVAYRFETYTLLYQI